MVLAFPPVAKENFELPGTYDCNDWVFGYINFNLLVEG